MSERDCPDEMSVLWEEREERRRRDRLFAHHDCRDTAHPGCTECRDDLPQSPTLDDAYAEGRKDEREEMIALLKEEAASIRGQGDGCHDGRYDWMAAGIEAAADAFGGIDSATGKPATPELMKELTRPAFWYADDGGSMLALFRTEAEWRDFCADAEPLNAGPLYLAITRI
jgi:hypothetical protein